MKYLYKGKTVSSVNISGKEIILYPDAVVELDDGEYTQTLLALSLLEKVEEKKKTKEVNENAG